MHNTCAQSHNKIGEYAWRPAICGNRGVKLCRNDGMVTTTTTCSSSEIRWSVGIRGDGYDRLEDGCGLVGVVTSTLLTQP